MTEYLDVEFEADPDALSQEAFDFLTTAIPNWSPAEGNLDVWLIRAIARIASEVQEMSSSVPTTVCGRQPVQHPAHRRRVGHRFHYVDNAR